MADNPDRNSMVYVPSARVRQVAMLLAASVAVLTGCNSAQRTTEADITRARQQEATDAREALDLVRQGQRMEDAGKVDKAIEAYRQAVATSREVPMAWNNLGRLLMQEGESMQAAECFKVASELSPSDPTPVHNLGTLWESMGWPDEASRFYADALSRNQNYLPSLRRSVMLDVNLSKVTDLTESRLRRALLLEKDAEWKELLLRAQVRLHDGSLTPRVPAAANAPATSPSPDAGWVERLLAETQVEPAKVPE